MSSRLYFIPVSQNDPVEIILKKINLLFDKAGFSACIGDKDLTAVKIHFGEDKNNTHLDPQLVFPVSANIRQAGGNPFLTDTCVLYKSRRDNAVEHLRLADDHGFKPEITGSPIVIADGLVGDEEAEVEITGEIFDRVSIARAVLQANSLIVMTHVTGHIGTGMGAALKNLGMGFASRKGKLRQHSVSKPKIKKKFCTGCGECLRWCPADSIEMTEENKAVINKEICIGCGECITVCRYGAVKHDWKMGEGEMQKRVAEHALGVVTGKKGKIGLFNFLINITRECDCMDKVQTPGIGNIGILAGTDPVALDTASLDLIEKHAGDDLSQAICTEIDARVQLEHGEKIGLGSREYDIVEINL